MTLEYTGLRVINVENFGRRRRAAAPTCARWTCAPRSRRAWARPTRPTTKKELRNVGPSISYKLRDAAGQAREFHNYMLPVDTGRRRAGVPAGHARHAGREPSATCACRPTTRARMDGFLRLRAALADPALREQAVRRYARAGDRSGAARTGRSSWRASAARALALFAGAERRADGKAAGRPAGHLRLPGSQRARGRARARRRGAGAHPQRRAVRAGPAQPRAGRPAAAAARRADAGLHDAGGAGAERRASSTRRRWPSS